jgi:hypothetical protein
MWRNIGFIDLECNESLGSVFPRKSHSLSKLKPATAEQHGPHNNTGDDDH